MDVRRADITVTAGVAGLSCAALAGAPTFVMTPLGILLLAAPGYVWCEVLLGSRVSGLDRVAVTAGMVLALPVVGGIVLTLGGFPLYRADWIGLLAVVTLTGDAVLLSRRRAWWRSLDGQAGAISHPGAARWKGLAWRKGRPGLATQVRRWLQAHKVPARHALAFGAAVLIAAGALGIARWGAAVQHYPGFTQLWLAPGSGRPAVTELGVSNHQGRTVRYRLVLDRNGRTTATWIITLADGQTWRRAVAARGRPAIGASLYRLPDLVHPYRRVFMGNSGGPG